MSEPLIVSDPKVMMSCSKDGGQTWSDAFEESLGALGNYGLGVRFTRCGWCPGPKGVMVRFRTADAVELSAVSAFITIEVGSH